MFQAFHLILIAYCFGSIYNIIKALRNGFKNFLTYWNILNVIRVATFLLYLTLKIMIVIEAHDKINYTEQEFIDTRNLCFLREIQTKVRMFMITVTLFYFLKHLDLNIIGPVSIFNIISGILFKILVFITIFFSGVIGCSFYCYLMYGVYIIGKVQILLHY